MSEDLQKMFVEDAPQQVNELNNAETLSINTLDLPVPISIKYANAFFSQDISNALS